MAEVVVTSEASTIIVLCDHARRNRLSSSEVTTLLTASGRHGRRSEHCKLVHPSDRRGVEHACTSDAHGQSCKDRELRQLASSR